MIRIPFFLLFVSKEGTQKEKVQKGTTQEPGNAEAVLKHCRARSSGQYIR